MPSRKVDNLETLIDDALVEGQNAIVAALGGVAGLHAAPTPKIAAPAATDEPSAIALANDLRSAYAAHVADVDVHLVADATNVLTTPAATDAASLYVLANDLKAAINGHLIEAASHPGEVPAQIYAYDDLRFPASAINPPGAISDPDRDTTTGLLLFDDNSTEIVTFQVQMPHEWSAGTVIEPHVHWIQESAGNVLWRLQYVIAPINGAVPAIPGDLVSIEASEAVFPYTSGRLHQITDIGGIDMAGFGESTMLVCALSRVGGDGADTISGDVSLLEIDIHYRKDKAGTVDASPGEAGVFPIGGAVTALEASDTASALVLVNDCRTAFDRHVSSSAPASKLTSIELVDS